MRSEARLEWEADRRARNANLVRRVKEERGCQRCGERRPWVLQFHHRDPSHKQFNICSSSLYSVDKMMEEIAKCDVLCANCHFDLHYWERHDDRPDSEDGGPDS